MCGNVLGCEGGGELDEVCGVDVRLEGWDEDGLFFWLCDMEGDGGKGFACVWCMQIVLWRLFDR